MKEKGLPPQGPVVRAKRSLGQNFLQNIGVARKMAELARLEPGDRVFEIGPGTGMLTRALAERGCRVVAMEKDDVLCARLQDVYRGHDRVTILHGDVLDADLNGLITQGMKVVSNLPYNIASALLVRLVGLARRIPIAVFMLQREVAERVCAEPGESGYSTLGALVRAGFVPGAAFVVAPANFVPRPRVESRVVVLNPRHDPVASEDMDLFRSVVLTAFGARRKTLRNTLVRLEGLDREVLSRIAHEVGLDLDARAHQVPPEIIYRFSKAYARIFCTPRADP